jgi:hypothetical protein
MGMAKWQNVSNEFSKSRELHLKTDLVLLKVIQTNYGFDLQVSDSYTGLFLRAFPCLDQEKALNIAEDVLYYISVRKPNVLLKDLIREM